jgi:hypothetical protein
MSNSAPKLPVCSNIVQIAAGPAYYSAEIRPQQLDLPFLCRIHVDFIRIRLFAFGRKKGN